MMSAWSAFREGLVRSARYWQALVAFYITSLASALPFVFFPALNLAGSANRGSIRQAAQGIEAWMLIEALLARLYRAALGIEQAAAPEITSGLESILLFGLLAIADPVFHEKDDRMAKAPKQEAPTGAMASLFKRL